jgi:flagellar secretion chaperone FliS
MNTSYHAYRQTSITTSSPMKLVLMLYDGALNFLERSIEAMNQKEMKNKTIALNRARDIIEELNNSLNTEIGGAMAVQLRRLYFFMNRHLFQANLKNDIQAVQEVIRLLSSLREAWQHVHDQSSAPGGLPQGEIEAHSCRQSGIRI